LNRARSTAYRIEESRQLILQDEPRAQIKRDGNYWVLDDGQRAARRPCRFRVDDAAWERLRAAADQ